MSALSRRTCDKVKVANPETIESAIKYFDEDLKAFFSDFLNDEVTLVPIPRSSLMVAGSVWPGLSVTEIFARHGFGKEIILSLERFRPVPKSSGIYRADDRPSVQVHYESLNVNPLLISSRCITLIDDVLTLGRTAFACALKLKQAYPEKEIRIFSLIRSQGLVPEITRIVDPRKGRIIFYRSSGKTWVEETDVFF